MDLLALADFNLVARHGGFGRAARMSDRPKATLSRRVSELENSLGLRLFERGARTLTLTQEGKALYERTAPLLTELEETSAAIASGGNIPRGTLRISAPLLFCQIAMGRLAAEFAVKHPQVRLEVTSEDRPVDMVEEGYDLAIRVNPNPDETLVGRAFLRDRLVVVASPTIARPAISLVSGDLAAGRLVLWGEVDRSEISLWALYPSRRLLSARVSAFLDHLRSAFPLGTPNELAAYIEMTGAGRSGEVGDDIRKAKRASGRNQNR
ncbi:MAG TPA: LysR substrate-binding domain-containing protein [Steroidobacter sp.]|uniref:LysR family transcriptional regulator n=1 Tax=Steroidobacter sp. TaxID=1978227 RepID=UPI002ED8FF61